MAIELSEIQSELAEMRRHLERLDRQVATLRVRPEEVVAARRVIDGEEYVVTLADIERVKAADAAEGPIDDTPDTVWITLALSEKVRERRRRETPEVGYERSKHSFEKARARVLAEGKGLYDEREAALGD